MQKRKEIYIHHAPIRVWHWVNAVGFIFLILTGIQIRFAEVLNFMSLEEAIHLHNYVGFMVIPNFFMWLFYSLGSGQIMNYLPQRRQMFSRIKAQIVYYGYGIFKGDKNPHQIAPGRKFNVMQQQAYILIMFVLLPIQMISGVLLWEIKRFESYIGMIGGIKVVNSIHVLLFFFFCAFLISHIYLATLGHTATAHIKAMFTGYEEEHGNPPQKDRQPASTATGDANALAR